MTGPLKEATAIVQELMDIFDIAFTNKELLRGLSFEDFYNMASCMVRDGEAQRLYDALVTYIRKRATTTPRYEDFEFGVTCINDVCMYLDRTFVAHHQLTPIRPMALRLFEERAAYRTVALEHLRRHAAVVNKCAHTLHDLCVEVSHRPQHSGAKRARDEFESIASVFVV